VAKNGAGGGSNRSYEITSCAPGMLSRQELSACLEIIGRGGAVNLASAAVELPLAAVVAVARLGEEIVGVGAIKRVRREYAVDKASRSGTVFSPETQELGYVAVVEKHRGEHLSCRIVAELMSKDVGQLFATTDSERMKKTLEGAGFAQKGHEWIGLRGKLSLWLNK